MALHTAHILILDWIENALSRKFIDQPKETEKRAKLCVYVCRWDMRKQEKKTKKNENEMSSNESERIKSSIFYKI